MVPDMSDKNKVLESMRMAKELIQTKGKRKLYEAYTTTLPLKNKLKTTNLLNLSNR